MKNIVIFYENSLFFLKIHDFPRKFTIFQEKRDFSMKSREFSWKIHDFSWKFDFPRKIFSCQDLNLNLAIWTWTWTWLSARFKLLILFPPPMCGCKPPPGLKCGPIDSARRATSKNNAPGVVGDTFFGPIFLIFSVFGEVFLCISNIKTK